MASTTLITDMATAISTGPSAASTAKAIAAAGPIVDLPGALKTVKLKLQEANVLLTQVIASDIDAGDGIKTGLQGVLDSLA